MSPERLDLSAPMRPGVQPVESPFFVSYCRRDPKAGELPESRTGKSDFCVELMLGAPEQSRGRASLARPFDAERNQLSRESLTAIFGRGGYSSDERDRERTLRKLKLSQTNPGRGSKRAGHRKPRDETRSRPQLL